jgi:serine phosphatase RsbU (regulator of sigma subunit)
VERALDPGSYQFTAVSIPFWVAAAAIAVMSLYVALVRGAAALRYTFLGICVCVFPFVVGYGLNACTTDLDVVLFNTRWCLAPTPLAGAFVLMFDLALARQLAQRRALVSVAVAISIALGVVCATTDGVATMGWVTPSGVPFSYAGWFAPVHTGSIGAWVAIGGYTLYRQLDSEPSAVRRRQFRGAIWAFSIAALGTVDALLAYGIGWFPVSWFFLTVAAVMLLRSLIADDLVHAASFDPRAIAALAYLLAAGGGAWLLSRSERPAVAGVAAVGVFLLLRAAFAFAAFLGRSSGPADTPATRALRRYVADVQTARSIEHVGEATRKLVELAFGADRVALLVPSEGDYSWRDSAGPVLVEEATPDPRLFAWFAARRHPIARDAIVAARLADLREPLERLFDVHRAEAIAPLVSHDELVGVIVVAELPGDRALREDELELLRETAEHACAGVQYARMYRETQHRVEVSKEVELAAVVQETFVPDRADVDLGVLRLSGAYEPASRCGGDWWSSQRLPDGRVVVLIGDVTGHGVAAAMVTAAAKGSSDVALRLMGRDVDVVRLLQLLDGAVRRTGGRDFHMTCFATLFDPARRTMTFANAGHVVPYLFRAQQGSLDVLVARGNPLGASASPEYVAHTRDVSPGDLLVWYTDGLIECTDPTGRAYGDRRFQRALRRAATADAAADALRDQLLREAYVFQDGHPPADDITLVVGRVT